MSIEVNIVEQITDGHYLALLADRERLAHEIVARDKLTVAKVLAAGLVIAHSRRVVELIASNNELLERARKAEARADGMRAALLAMARTGAAIAKELEREMDRNAGGEIV